MVNTIAWGFIAFILIGLLACMFGMWLCNYVLGIYGR